MLKYYNYDIVFQEIPDEVSLAINITQCPNCCVGCHSPHLQSDCGEILSVEALVDILDKYAAFVTCVCIMGGDASPKDVAEIAGLVRRYRSDLKVGWYSGRPNLPQQFPIERFDYVKLGAYIESCGSLRSRTTNQRLYKVCEGGELRDITERFWKPEPAVCF